MIPGSIVEWPNRLASFNKEKKQTKKPPQNQGLWTEAPKCDYIPLWDPENPLMPLGLQQAVILAFWLSHKKQQRRQGLTHLFLLTFFQGLRQAKIRLYLDT